MIGPDIVFRHVLAFVVPFGFAVMVFLASRVTHFFWARLTGVMLALLIFYFTMRIMNRLLFERPRPKEESPDDAVEPPAAV